MKDIMKKIALLSLGIPSPMMVALLSSSLIYIIKEYAEYEETFVTMILTIPNLTIMIGLLLAPILMNICGIKRTIIIGLVIFLTPNVLLVYTKNFYLLLLLRAIGGIGCGLVLPLQMTFFATYPETERATLMGLSTSLGCIVAALLASVSGVIAMVNWRYVAYLFLLCGISLVLSMIFIPKNLEITEIDEGIVPEKNTKTQISYKKILITYYLLLTAGFLFMSVLNVEIAPYLESIGLGSSTESGIVISIFMIGNMVAGLLLGQYVRKLKQLSIPVIFFFSMIGFALLSFASSLNMVGVASFIIGMCSCLISSIVNYELSRLLPLRIFTSASAGTNFFVFTLQFLSPIVFLKILSLVPCSSFRITFIVYAAIQAIFIMIAYLLIKMLENQKGKIL